MSAELANRLIDFFQQPGAYGAFLVGGGDWYLRLAGEGARRLRLKLPVPAAIPLEP
jgi:hypothetical protein